MLGGGAGLDAVNAAYAALLRSYGELGGSTECSIANSVWADLEGQIFEEFIGKCQGIFDAQVFQQGAADLLNVTNAQSSLLSAEDGLATADTDIETDLVSLFKALGGGWQVADAPSGT